MKYVCLGYMDDKAWEGSTESDRNAFMDGCFAYDEQLQRNGHWVGGEGLQPAEHATMLKWRNGKVSVTDGPFAETKEQIGGIMIIEATDLNHAIRLMSEHPSLRLSKGATSWEIRPAADLEALIEESRKRREQQGN